MNNTQNEVREAISVLNDYYGVLARHVAREILSRKEDFKSAEADRADAILEKYARQVSRLSQIYGILRGEAYIDKPEGTEPLARNEFRCFGCGGVIQANDQECPLCHWSWK